MITTINLNILTWRNRIF